MFVHLHVHSHFSFLDSPSPPVALVRRAAKLGMPALALTDSGVLHGVPSFVLACRHQGIRPLVGIQLAFRVGEPGAAAPAAAPAGPREATFEVVLICRDRVGYQNLCRLSSTAQGVGEDGDAGCGADALPVSALQEHAEGLVCLMSCSHTLLKLEAAGQRKRTATLAGLLRDLFGGRFFVELPATTTAPRSLVTALVDLAAGAGIPLAATADVHYAEPREAALRWLLLASRKPAPSGRPDGGKPRRTPEPVRRETGDLWLCPEREIRRRLAFLPRGAVEEALANTVAIAEECRWDLEPLAGVSPRDGGSTDAARRLRRAAEEGCRSRYPAGEPPEARARLERELETIVGRGLADYFLLAHRVASWCRREGIPLGPGRGSAAGSLVCYCLGITDVDPLAEGLLFERFFNPERPDLPDIDMDVCQRRRPEVMAMLTREAGAVGVVAFTTLGPRSALRLAGRALGLPADRMRALSAAIPGERGPGALARALATVPELRAIPREREPFRTLFEMAESLEGIPVGRSRHPSGVVAAPPDRRAALPVYRAPDGQPVSQYDADSLELLGLPKLDVLGLRHLTVAGDTERMVRRVHPAFSVDHLDPEDPLTWDLIDAGETVGCFQLESEGMRRLLQRMRPRSLPELATAIASYKPGPLRARRRPTDRPPPLLQEILAPTRGILVYQEQVMEAGQRVAGMTAGEADLMRRVLEKGDRADPALLRQWETRFLEGARRLGMPEAEAREVFQWLSGAAGYTFNRAHATCYARLAFQAAYLKAHHPAPYLAALLSNPGGYYPPELYLYEARRLGITVLPAHPNHSGAFWRAEKRAIRAGLLSLPGVGPRAALACLQERARGGDFRSPRDLALRLEGRLPRKALWALLRAWEEAENARAETVGPGGENGLQGLAGREVVLRGRVVQGERVPAPGGGYRLVLLVDTGREMVHVHVPARVYQRDALELDPGHLTVRGRLQRRGGQWHLLATALTGQR